MTTYPTGREDRTRLRAREARRIQALADRQKTAVGRSIKCSGGHSPAENYPVRHASDPGGCEGGPANCLCECHDNQPTPTEGCQ